MVNKVKYIIDYYTNDDERVIYLTPQNGGNYSDVKSVFDLFSKFIDKRINSSYWCYCTGDEARESRYKLKDNGIPIKNSICIFLRAKHVPLSSVYRLIDDVFNSIMNRLHFEDSPPLEE